MNRIVCLSVILVCVAGSYEIANITHQMNGHADNQLTYNATYAATPTAAALSRMDQALADAMYVVRVGCDLLDMDLPHPRIAPLVFENMGGSVIMKAATLFVLRDASVPNTSVSRYWVPMSLARHNARDTPNELAALDALSPYDAWITVNPNIGDGFGVGASDCDFVVDTPSGHQSYSATSAMLHELLHAMGVATMLSPATPGGTNGYGSVMDSLVRTDDGQELLGTATPPSIESIAGSSVTVMGHPVYNPDPYIPGSSMSHFVGSGVMSSSLDPSTCKFTLTDAVIDTLVGIGWGCNRTNDVHTWDRAVMLITNAALGGESSTINEHGSDSAGVTALWVSGLVVALMIISIGVYVWWPRGNRAYTHV